jgi:hypothetical protein
VLAAAGCKGGPDPGTSPPTRADRPVSAQAGAKAGGGGPAPAPGGGVGGAATEEGTGAKALDEEPEAGSKVLLVEDGKEKWIDGQEAVAGGYTLIDLGDDWTPALFDEQHDEKGKPLPNRYRRVFIGLSNDQLDRDGQPLSPGEKNYLELYGIFPSLSVIRARFLEDETKSCVDPEGQPALEAVEYVSYVAPEAMKRDAVKLARIRQELETARKKFRAATFTDLVETRKEFGEKVKLLEKRAAEKVAMAEVEKRLACEGLLGGKGRFAHKTGVYDEAMRLAVRAFQQKHMIYESNYLRRKTMDALGQPNLAHDHASLVRALRERVIAAAGIVEDGSAEVRGAAPKYTNAAGKKVPVANLADEYTDTTVKQLGLDTPEKTLAFFKRHSAADLRHLRAAVKLPPRPEYYSDHMDLSLVIDRGDVWYDPPFDDKGKWTVQPRKRFPSMTVYVHYRDQQIPLTRWRTTIGGWRAEQASNGFEYYRYKGSDVGPRVIRQVVAGPVWIAPSSTPIRSLTKMKTVNGKWESVVNYDELGPGYLSAYGVVAGYFVIPGKDGRPDFDNGIRAHGSSEYLSMYSANGYSHGCHRLPNHLAIRLYDFMLHHRTLRVNGDSSMGFARQFLWKDMVYEIRIPSRGYIFALDPPVPVNVLEGEIKGNAKKPILGYVPKPGVRYPPGPPPSIKGDSPEARAGGAAPAAGGGEEE